MICNDLPNFIAYSVKKSKSNTTTNTWFLDLDGAGVYNHIQEWREKS